MTNPTRDELVEAVTKHRGLASDAQMFDDPPSVSIRYVCGDCGITMAPVQLGWELITQAIDDGLPIPDEPVISTCDKCEKEAEG